MFGRKTATAIGSAGLVLATVATAGTSAQADTTQLAPATTATAGDDLLSMGDLHITKLKSDKVVVRSTPGDRSHWFAFDTKTPYWSVIAVDPDDYVDVDLRLFTSPDSKTPLAESLVGPGSVDFIAVDSHHYNPSTFFAEVNKVESHGKYEIEVSKGSQVLGDALQQVMIKDSAPVAIRDTLLVAGTSYRFVMWPTEGQMNGKLCLLDSDPEDDDTLVQSREDAIVCTYNPAGKPAIIDFTPSTTDLYGLVVLSTGTNGTFNLQRVRT